MYIKFFAFSLLLMARKHKHAGWLIRQCGVQVVTYARLNSLKSISVLGELRMGAAELRKHSHVSRRIICTGNVYSVDVYLSAGEFCTVDTGECVTQIVSFIYDHHLQRHARVFTVQNACG